MFPARHSNGLYLVTSARVWIFFSVQIFTFFTDICRFFFKILTLSDAEFNSVSVSFTKTWKFLQFSHYVFEKYRQCRSWGWFYTVSWNAGCGCMCKINPMIDIADFFLTQVIFIFQPEKKNVKIWGCHDLRCAFYRWLKNFNYIKFQLPHDYFKSW